MKVLLAHPGTQHALTLASELERRNLLSEFWTCFALSEDSVRAHLLRLLPGVRKRIENRLVSLPSARLRTVPSLERKARRQQARGVESELVMQERNERFQEAVLQSSLESADAVIGFDTSSWLLIDRSHRAGKRFILDQTTAHPKKGRDAWRRAGENFPEWRTVAPASLESMLHNQDLEHEQADLIVTPSSFARDSLIANGVDETKIRVNSYGVDLNRFRPSIKSNTSHPLRFVFVGGLTARKGVPLLLLAWEKLKPKDAELWLVGDVGDNIRKLIPEITGLKILGRKTRAQLPEILRSCDVFVLPSYFEGFGLVLLEAMASGLPIISTEATAAPDLVNSNDVGKIIQSGDVDQLVEAMNYFMEHLNDLPRMSKAARARAEQITWAVYGDRWEKILSSMERGARSAE